jgi:hypothetical protein
LQFDVGGRLRIYDKATSAAYGNAENTNGHELGARTSGVTRRGRPVTEPEGINVTYLI